MAGYDGRGTKFPLTIARGADMAFALTVVDSNAAAVDMSAATIAGNIYTKAGTLVDTMTASVSGASSNIVTLSFTDTETAAFLASGYQWSLMVTRGADTRPWLAGAVNVVDPAVGGQSTTGDTTLTVDGDLTVTVTVSGAGYQTAADHITDTVDAHDASAISILDTGGYYTGTTVEAALAELPAQYPPRPADDGTVGQALKIASLTPLVTEWGDAGSSTDSLVVISDNGDPITDASTARPVGAAACLWVMSNGVTPTNAIFPDIINTADAVTPTTTFIGVGAMGAQNTAVTLTAAWPTSYTAVANDVAILVLAGTHGNGSTISSDLSGIGYTLVSTIFTEIGSFDSQVSVYSKVLTTAEAAPALTVPAIYVNAFAVLTAQVMVFRDVDTTTPIDVTATTVSNTTALSAQVGPSITPVTNGATVVSIMGINKSRLLAITVDQGFTEVAGGDSYSTTTGGDYSVGLAIKTVDPAAATTAPTWGLTGGAEKGGSVAIALRPA